MNKAVSSLACLLLALLLFAGSAQAAPNYSVLLLPFTINGPSVDENLRKNLDSLLQHSFTQQNFRVLNTAEGQRSMKQANISTINATTALTLARRAKTSCVVFGTLNQVGEGFSLDMQVVDTAKGSTRSLFTERVSMVELAPAVAELASKAYAGSSSQDTISDIQIRGISVLDPDVVLVRLQNRKGDVILPDNLDKDLSRVWDLGYFEDVAFTLEPGPSGQVLIITVVEKPRIDDVVINGSDAVSKTDIQAAMTSRTGTVLNQKALSGDLQKITELYRKEGYYNVDVSYEVQPRSTPQTALLVLNVKEGNKLYIKAVNIEGMEKLDRGDLNDYLSLRPRNIISWITGSGVLKEEFLERDSQAITAYAIDKGYINAQVSSPEVTFDETGIIITYRMREGERYALGDISFKGDLIDTPERLYTLIGLDEVKEKSTYFSLNTMQDDIKKLTEFYNDYGYAFANVTVDTIPHENAAIVDIHYILQPQEKVYLRRVEVEGNTRTRDNVILRELRVADGQEFSGAKLRRTNERLNKLGYFGAVDTQLVPTGVPGEVDLKIKVEEANTGMLSAGVGYSTYDKFGVTANIAENNLFGRGYTLSLQGYLSSKEVSMNLGFINPRLYDTDLGFGINLYGIDHEWTDFDKRTYGSTVSFFYPLGEYTGARWGYRLDNYKLSNANLHAAPSIREYSGKNRWASVVFAGVSRDTTDSKDPTRGTRFGVNVEYGGGGIGGSDNFVKPTIEYGFFYGLNNNHVLHARASAGAVFRNSNKIVPVFERFYIGGMDSVRGYDIDDLSPRDPRTGESIGSDRMAYASFEYIWHFNRDLGLAVVPFVDMGISVDSAQTKDLFSNVYYSTGLELRWKSPMGDLRFAYGYPLSKNVIKEKNGGRFEFTMGQAF